MRYLSVVLGGLVFGFGLAVSGMADPKNVLAFLTLSDQWNPALLLVMASALLVSAIGYRLVLARTKPLFVDAFHLPTRQDIEGRLVTGAGLFGLGWGMAGYCPGPAFVGAFAMDYRALVFLLSFVVAVACFELVNRYYAAQTAAHSAGDG